MLRWQPAQARKIMSRFETFFREQIDATTLTVYHHPNDASTPLIGSQVKAAVVDARLLLKNTLAALASGSPDDNSKIIKYAHRYFQTADWGVDAQDMKKIHDKILLISNGLNADIDLKIHRIPPDKKGVETVAFVTSKATVLYPQKPLHEVNRREVPTKADPDKYMPWNFLYGTIHITPEQVSSGRSGVRTLIHEASHRYTGTEDHCYCNYDGTGFAPKPRNFRKDRPIKDQLLNNADSYAWFILKVGRGGDGFTNKMTK